VLEHLLAAVEGQHRRRPVAAQVVQAHDAPVGILRQRFGLQQLQRQRQGAGGVAGGFQRFDAVFQGFARTAPGGHCGGRPARHRARGIQAPANRPAGRALRPDRA
jgi:hypothetical protein